VAIAGDEFEEELEVVVPDVGVDQFLALAIHDADVHLVGMEVDSAVVFGRGGVIFHTIIRKGVARHRVNTIGYAGRCWYTSPPCAQ
jgi:hypothetical protein